MQLCSHAAVPPWRACSLGSRAVGMLCAGGPRVNHAAAEAVCRVAAGQVIECAQYFSPLRSSFARLTLPACLACN